MSLVSHVLRDAPVKLNRTTVQDWVRDPPRGRVPRPNKREACHVLTAALYERARKRGTPAPRRIPNSAWDHMRDEAGRERRSLNQMSVPAADPLSITPRPIQVSRPITPTTTDRAARIVSWSEANRAQLAPEILPNVNRLQEFKAATESIGIRSSGACAIVGEGGLGKSVLLGQIYDDWKTAGDVLPILIRCARIPSSASLSSVAELDNALGFAATDDDNTPPLTVVLTGLLETNVVRVLVDTVDLIVHEENADDVGNLIRRIAQMADVTFTCREQEWMDFLAPAGDTAGTLYSLPPLTSPQIGVWARAYMESVDIEIDPAQRRSFIASASAASARILCSSPLRLAMACDIYGQTGGIPEDLTVTALYERYWQHRIASDRKGRPNTRRAREQEDAAIALADEMWGDSRLGMTISATGSKILGRDGLQALLSEGIVDSIGRRYEFFHQTYAEFAIARWLRDFGEQGDLDRLSALLSHGHGNGAWPIARHLVSLPMAEARYEQLCNAIPWSNAEGLRLRILGALHHSDDALLEDLLSRVDARELLAAITVVDDGPEESVPAGGRLLLHCLPGLEPGDVSLVTATAVRLHRRLPQELGTGFLLQVIAAILDVPDESGELLPSVIRRFLSAALEDASDASFAGIVGLYGSLPNAARAALLEHAAARVPPRASDGSLVSTALAFELPSTAVDSATILLSRNWLSTAVRDRFGWMSWRDLLEAKCPQRWDTCQIRAISTLCESDTPLAQEVLTIAFGNEDVPRDRYTNVVKFIADRDATAIVEAIVNQEQEPSRNVVGAQCSVLNYISDQLSEAQRTQVGSALRVWSSIDSRRVWPSLVKLASRDARTLEEYIDELAQFDRDSPTEAPVVASAVDTFLNACTPKALVEVASSLQELIPDSKKNRERRAKLDGIIARWDESARTRTDDRLSGTSPNAASAAAAGIEHSIRLTDLKSVSANELRWLSAMIAGPHAKAVRTITDLLRSVVDSDPSFGSLLPNDFDNSLVERISRSLTQAEDIQTTASLVDLLITRNLTRGVDPSLRRRTLDQLAHEVQSWLLPTAPQSQRRHLPALFNLYLSTLAVLGLRYDDLDVTRATVESILQTIDVGMIAGRSARKLSHFLTIATTRDPRLFTTLENAWPQVSDATKGAIAECIELAEAGTEGKRSVALARRDDCPPRIAHEIHTKFGS